MNDDNSNGKDQMSLYAGVARRIALHIQACGGLALEVGGAVRDSFWGLPAKDLDMECYGLTPEQVETALKALGEVKLAGESFSVFKLRIEGIEVDVALARRERKISVGHKGFEVETAPNLSVFEASERRNYTMNAIARNPLTGEVYDYFNGVRDLRQRILRHTSARFVEDELRPLVGARLASKRNLTIAPETAELCKSMLPLYHNLPFDRVWGEWAGLTLGHWPSMGIRALQEMGWLSLYSEIDALDKIPQDSQMHPEGTVLEHTKMVMDEAAEIAERDSLSDEEHQILLLSALTHDIGKVTTTTTDENGRIHSRGHAELSAELVPRCLKKISPPLSYYKPVQALVRHHMAYVDFVKTSSERIVRRLAFKLDESNTNVRQLVRLIEADLRGRATKPDQTTMEHLEQILLVAERLDVAYNAPKRLFMGRHLMEMNLPPGPEYSRIINAVYEAQLEGQITTFEEAKAYAKQLLLSKNGQNRGV